MPYLLLLFIVMPIVEIAVLIRVGGAIGLLPTLLIVILTAVIGTNMLRQQGRATLERARSRLGSGEMPASEIVEGLLRFREFVPLGSVDDRGKTYSVRVNWA